MSAMLLLRPQALVPQERREVLSVDVELVNVTATVIDESGRSVQGLTAEDFQVLEDGQEQKISFFSHDSRVPISLGVLLDISGSLQDKLRQGLQTVREIASTLTADDEMFVVMFNSHVDVRQKFTSNPEEIQRSLGDIHAKGETAVYDAISVGLHEMQTAKNQKQILLLVTDGFDTKSKMSADQAQDLLRRSHVLLYAIGIDDDDNNPPRGRAKYHIYDYMLGKLTDAGGGRLVRLYTGRHYDASWISEMFLTELRQAYTIGYYPNKAVDNATWRNVEVRVTKPGVRIVGDKDRRYKRTIIGRGSER
ncbi:MAG TPA: VWA domain-containing protein [Pyrinomonadaceae bacterium]|nr:VWA domain-containing protein [Pyrinomonadaceae bacterium]